MQLYPLKFRTIYKDKIWGGEKIKTHLGKDYGALPNCGETWELSGVPGNVSRVANGGYQGRGLTDLIEEFREALTGNKVYNHFGTEFPLLIKFIDACQDLSIQVHPDDQLAKKRHNCSGKTEMWYVLQADEGASLISGFNRAVTREEYLDKLNSGDLIDILNREEVQAGDVFYLPAGRVHTIGKGLLIAEIQQTSDITYRIYDFDRTDAAGNKRELHTEEALDAIDYAAYPEYKTSYEDKKDELVQVVKAPYFETNRLSLTENYERAFRNADSFRIYICTSGKGKISIKENVTRLEKGETVLIPAAAESVLLQPDGPWDLLETYVP